MIDNDVYFYDLGFYSFTEWSTLVQNSTNIEAIGQLVYTYFFHDFLLAGIILLVAMIGAIVLTMHRGANIKVQDVFEQNTRDFQKTVIKRRHSVDVKRIVL